MTTVLINSIIIQTIDLMNAMQRRGSLKDKCFSQYKNSPSQAHAACTHCAHDEEAPRPHEPECGRSCSSGRRPSARHATGLQATCGWPKTPALHGTPGAARLGSAPRTPDHPVEAVIILCIMNGRLSVLRAGSKARRWVS